MSTGTLYKSARLFYSSSLNLQGLTANNWYWFQPVSGSSGQLGPAVAASLSSTTWSTLLKSYQPGNGIFQLPDNATNLVIHANAQAMTGSAGLALQIGYLFDPPTAAPIVPMTDVSGTLITVQTITASSATVLSLPLRPTAAIVGSTTPVTAVPYRFFMVGVLATTYPTSNGVLGPVEVYYT